MAQNFALRFEYSHASADTSSYPGAPWGAGGRTAGWRALLRARVRAPHSAIRLGCGLGISWDARTTNRCPPANQKRPPLRSLGTSPTKPAMAKKSVMRWCSTCPESSIDVACCEGKFVRAPGRRRAADGRRQAPPARQRSPVLAWQSPLSINPSTFVDLGVLFNSPAEEGWRLPGLCFVCSLAGRSNRQGATDFAFTG